jgi:hypothetical protein
LAVHEPPLGLPFVDNNFYVARPWVEWLLLTQVNLVDIEDDIDEIEVDIAQIDINTAAIAVNTADIVVLEAVTDALEDDIVDLEAADLVLTASVLSNEALSFYYASL